MLFIKSHKMNVQPNGYAGLGADPDRSVSMSAACGFPTSQPYPNAMDAPFARFNYLFPDTPVPQHTDTTTEDLDRLADSMVDRAQAEDANSDVAAIITYLGQFIDHDITAGTDRKVQFSDVDIDDVAPLDRADVLATLANLRTGALDLDSLYGGATVQGEFAAEMTRRLRHPRFRAKLRIGTDVFVEASGPRPDRPRSKQDDPAHDLLRADRLIKDADPLFTSDNFDSLPDDLKEFLTEDGSTAPNPVRAVIGDGRNDENLAVATVHLAFARLHNRIVDHAPAGTADEQFEWARQRVRWIYQWLIVNVYLPSVCDAETLAQVIDGNAAIYKDFKDRTVGHDGHMPIPLEFSVAAFRFGHTTARPDYDWNGNFGRAKPGTAAKFPRARFQEMFLFTGNGKMGGGAPHLPSGWMVDVDHFLNTGATAHSDRNTRLIDTQLAPPLMDMQNEPAGLKGVLKVLPRRNLRRSQRLALPSAQACLDAFSAQGIDMPRLTTQQLRSGATGAALSDGLAEETPIWFYILKEAEVLNNGLRLGPLGTRLIAETLVGLVWHGKNTYRTQAGSDGGVWHPRDDVQPQGEPVDSLLAVMRAALMA